jgi:hypothetical protein
MRNTLYAASLVAIVLQVTAGSAAAQEVGRLRYEIDATFDLERSEIQGHARIEVPYSLLWSPSEIRLDLKSAGADSLDRPRLEITSVRIADELRTTDVAEGYLRVSLPVAARVGEVVVLEIDYMCAFNTSYDLLGYHSFWSVGPGSYWYPDVVGAGNARGRFKDFLVTLNYPSEFAAVTSGTPDSQATEAGGFTQATFQAEHVEGFSVSLAEGFEVHAVEGDGYKVIGLIPPDDPEPFGQAIGLAAEAVEWYRDTYGFLPVKQIGIVPGPSRWSGGYPLPNVFMIHRGTLRPSFLRWITAHELGHYYWGLYVLSATSERLDWLNLANGIWADHLYMAETSARTVDEVLRDPGAGDMLVAYLQAMLENREQRLGLTGEEEEELGFDYNSLIRHGKATVGVYLQARKLGPERYVELQRGILRDYPYRPLPLEDYVARLEAAGASGAMEFFKEWVRGDARIEYDVLDIASEVVPAGWVHTVRVRQAGTVPFDLDVQLVGTSGSRVERSLTPEAFEDGREHELKVTMDEPLAEVRLDPDGLLPMLNSSNQGVRRAYLRAMTRADMTALFLDVGAAYLADFPDDDRARLDYVFRLFDLSQHDRIVEMLDPLVRGAEGGPAAACATRYACWSAILLARSLNAKGQVEEASEILRIIETEARKHNLERRWDEAAGEAERAGSG